MTRREAARLKHPKSAHRAIAATPATAADLGDLPFKPVGDGVRVAVRLTPRASRNGVDGIFRDVDGAPVLKLRVVAAPVEGAANAALLAYLAEKLKLRKSDVKIASGEGSRLKIVHIAGRPDQILAALTVLLSPDRPA
jgi:uncharacterized protein (TIGR00251 family)